jgi:hypothetical protein
LNPERSKDIPTVSGGSGLGQLETVQPEDAPGSDMESDTDDSDHTFSDREADTPDSDTELDTASDSDRDTVTVTDSDSESDRDPEPESDVPIGGEYWYITNSGIEVDPVDPEEEEESDSENGAANNPSGED